MIFYNECNNSDSQTLISDITDNDNTVSSENFEDKLNEIKIKLNTDLNKLNSDNLKDKCKELGIKGYSSKNKQTLIGLIQDKLGLVTEHDTNCKVTKSSKEDVFAL